MNARFDMSDFWDRVSACQHEEYPNYGVGLPCTCGHSLEWHCKKCGAYITDDPCGEQSGMSGWPHKRRKAAFASAE